MTAPPVRILLATDLSCRGDRALDRAAQLCRQWGAGLVVAHVMEAAERGGGAMWMRPEWHRPADPAAGMRSRIAHDLAGHVDDLATFDVQVAVGDPAERIVEIAEREECGLIVTGVARDELLGRMFTGTTVNQLVRRSRVPLLVVRERGRRPYASIAVATDFSETSLQALLAALALFPDAAVTLLHAHDVPPAPMGEGGNGAFVEIERRMRSEFLDPAPIEPAVRDKLGIRIERGDAERVVTEHVRDHRVDLTVIGSHGRGALFDVLVGSVTKRLLEAVGSDVLVVVDPRARR